MSLLHANAYNLIDFFFSKRISHLKIYKHESESITNKIENSLLEMILLFLTLEGRWIAQNSFLKAQTHGLNKVAVHTTSFAGVSDFSLLLFVSTHLGG